MPYIPSMKPAITIGLDGEYYPSGLEFRCAGMMDLVGFKYTHEGYAFVCSIRGGQYKPDFVWELPNGHLGICEIKGWNQPRAEAAADIIRDFCDDPHHPVDEFVYGWSKNVLYYHNEREADGAMYMCKSCGKPTWSFVDDHECSFCGGHELEFVCVDFNNYWNKEWEKQWSKTWQRYINKNATEEGIRDYIRNYAEKHSNHIDLKEGKNKKGVRTLCMITEQIKPGQWDPDFWYTEQPKNRDLYGLAKAPIALVIVNECPTNSEKRAIRECLRHVADQYSLIVKLVLMDKHTTLVADHFTGAKLEEGHLYKCNHCDGEFFAADQYTECPYCGSKQTEQTSGKE